jgi:hypothetical protein
LASDDDDFLLAFDSFGGSTFVHTPAANLTVEAASETWLGDLAEPFRCENAWLDHTA